jgi:hypothetical protein
MTGVKRKYVPVEAHAVKTAVKRRSFYSSALDKL